MEKYGEFLFEAKSDDIKVCLDNLTEEDIESCCEYKIFNRGYDYYHNGMVEQIQFNKKANTISATVTGTREYRVEIYIDNGELHGTCSCEYYAVCKHIIAVLLNIADTGIENIPEDIITHVTTAESLDFLKSHLKQLPKEELIKLVMKFAPEEYILQAHNRETGKKDANKIFTQAEKKILGFFNNEEMLWDPSGMETALMSQLNKLKGLEDQIPDQIGELILKIMQEVNNAFDEGYLYIDNYYNEDYFESNQFDNYVISYIRQLPVIEKMSFLEKLDDTIELMSYNTFEGIPQKYDSCFTDKELDILAEYIVANQHIIHESLISNLFYLIEKKLKIEEKEKILTRISRDNQDLFTSLTELLIEQNRHSEAFENIDKLLSENKGFVDDKIIELYLDLCVKTGSDLDKAVMVSINHNPNEKILLKIKTYSITDIKVKACENILKNKNPYDLLSYFEKEKRFKEAFDLISETNQFRDEIIFTFFRRNKKVLTSEAEQYFLKRIKTNLPYTGDNHYTKIAETIGQLKQINNKLSKEIVTGIRMNYKRRTKLMGMLRRF